jgi:uncharacterized membrane protein
MARAKTPKPARPVRTPMVLSPMLGPLLAPRPRLTASLAVGIAASFAVGLLIPGVKLPTALIAGWDALAVTFIVSMLFSMVEYSPEDIRARAASDDQGRVAILALVLVAVAASIGAVVLELSMAKDAWGLEKWPPIILAFGTVTASWFMVQMIFTIHYAHEYYGVDETTPTGDAGGLLFPGDESPDYWDFLHFSIVIGVASQTADVQFTSKGLRRLGTVHSLVAFAFNTVIVALTINLMAGLF